MVLGGLGFFAEGSKGCRKGVIFLTLETTWSGTFGFNSFLYR